MIAMSVAETSSSGMWVLISNNMKTCTIIRLNNVILFLSCTLGIDIEMLRKIYYLLYGSEFFSD